MRNLLLIIFCLFAFNLLAQDKSNAEIIRGDSIALVNIVAYPNPVRANEFTTIEIEGGLTVGYEVIAWKIGGSGEITHNFRTTARKIRLSFRESGFYSLVVWVTMPNGRIKQYDRKLFVD